MWPCVNMQKIGLFHRLILQIQSILESCQQTERACSFLTMLTWKIFNHLICVKLYQLAKNQSTRSFHSLDVVNFRVHTRDWPCTFLTMLNLKLFDQLYFCEFVWTLKKCGCVIDLFRKNGWFEDPAISRAETILNYISATRFFPNRRFVQEHIK